MTIQVMTSLPGRAISGDRLRVVLSGEDHPPADYTGTLTMARESDGNFSTTTGSDYDGAQFLYELDAPAAGLYHWSHIVTDVSGNSVTLASGRLTLTARPADGVDPRSDVKKTLDALNATLLGKASQDQLSHSINGRSISRFSPDELTKWLDHYQRQYQRELDALAADEGRAGSGAYFAQF